MWMVDRAWLEANREQNDHPNRLAASGKLWGDLEDPEEVDERVKNVKTEKKAKKQTKKRKAENDDGHGEDGKFGGKKQKKAKGNEDAGGSRDLVETMGGPDKAGESSQ